MHEPFFIITISDKKLGVASSSNSSLISYYEPDIRTAQDYYPFGMLMPGRKGFASGTVWVVEGSGSTLPASVSYNTRSGNTPLEYKATNSIEFTEGFESGVGDEFVAYITTDEGSGGSSGIEGSEGVYRYGFNGKENDNEVKGEGAQQDYGMRIYDPRLGKFLSVDPLFKDYSMMTPYQYASNNPIAGIDLDGGEFKYYSLKFQPQADGQSHLTIDKQVGVSNRSFHTNITTFGTPHPVVIVPGGKIGPPILSTSDRYSKDIRFTMQDLGLNPTVVSPDGKAWKVLPAYMDLKDLPSLNDAIWNTLETPEQYVDRFLENANNVIKGAQNATQVVSIIHGNIKDGNLGAAKNGNLLDNHNLSKEKLLEQGEKLDRNGLTKAGRALQKHGAREGSVFPKVSGKEYNQKGKEILDGILSSDNQLIKPTEKGGKVIFDQTTGRGAAFTKDGSFNGFRELHLE